MSFHCKRGARRAKILPNSCTNGDCEAKLELHVGSAPQVDCMTCTTSQLHDMYQHQLQQYTVEATACVQFSEVLANVEINDSDRIRLTFWKEKAFKMDC
eukprot:866175-Pelagomonas_calceolata.AAC.5